MQLGMPGGLRKVSEDLRMQQLYASHYRQQAGQALHAQQMTDWANGAVVFNSLTGRNPVSSWPEFNSDPKRKAAFDAPDKTDTSIYDKVDRAININAQAQRSPVARTAACVLVWNRLEKPEIIPFESPDK